jgi:hypothetical protein
MSTPLYTPTFLTAVYRSLRMVGAYDAAKSPAPEQVEQATETLYMMLKAWQVDNPLWLISQFQLTLTANTYYYQFGPAGTAAQYWPALTTPINRPTRVWNLRRKNTSGVEIQLNGDGLPMARVDYMQLPNKTTTGTVTQAYFDPQLTNGVFYVWPAPQTGVTDVIIGDCDRPILIPEEGSDDTFDMPMEWLDPICFCLAERLWFEYPGNGAEYQLLAQRAAVAKDAILNYNRDPAATQYQPDMRR